MGLDIYAMSHARRTSQESGVSVYPNRDFPDQADDLLGGWYMGDAGSETFHFRAGSYSGYNEWRTELAKMAHGVEASEIWDADKSEYPAFYELICFSDCEGTIGPRTSAKLLEDFKAYQVQAAEHDNKLGPAIWFLDLYMQWMKAFALASQNGFVAFH